MASRRWLVAALLAALGWTLTGCHTVEGIGRDVEAAGRAIQDAAE